MCPTTEFRADLHCHSTCSDGTFTPEELLREAQAKGLKGLSITDHDTVAAYETAIPLAREMGIELLTGVEFSTTVKEQSVHVLAYGFDVQHEELHAFCQRHKERREERNIRMLESLKKGGITIEVCELAQDTHAIGRPHIAKALIDKGYAKDLREVFTEFIGGNSPYFVKTSSFGLEETLALIRSVGGKAVLAHPHLINNQGLVDYLLQQAFDGMEVFYARMPPHKERPWVKRAQKRGWIQTGGSDFHGTVKPHISLGCSWTGIDSFNALKQGSEISC